MDSPLKKIIIPTCVVVFITVFTAAGKAATTIPLTVESTFKVSGSGTGFSATLSIFDRWDEDDVRLGINSDPIIGGFWLRFAKNGVITDYSLGIADAEYHTYKIEYDGSNVKIYIDHLLKKTVTVTLTEINIALHANARAIGDVVSAQFDDVTISNEATFADSFDDGIIEPKWVISKADWMNIAEQKGVLDMSGTATEQYWITGGLAILTSESLQPLIATIDIDPDTLNLQSKVKWVTCYIEFLEGYHVADIDVSTVKLNGEVSAESEPTAIGDYDGDGIVDLMVKFDRAAMQGILQVGDVEIMVTGELNDGTLFEGIDTIRVIDKGGNG